MGTSRAYSLKVWLTDSGKLRVRIREKRESTPYEVTIGGTEWSLGKGNIYSEAIHDKALKMLGHLSDAIQLLWDEPDDDGSPPTHDQVSNEDLTDLGQRSRSNATPNKAR